MEITLENVKTILDSGIEQAKEVVKDSSKVDDLLIQLEMALKEIPEIGDVLSDIPVLIAMVKGYITREYTDISVKVILTIISAFIYVVRKKDIISDNIPVAGQIDDLTVLLFAIKFVEPELNAYKEWRNRGIRTSLKEELTFDQILGKVRTMAASIDASDRDFLAVQVNITGDNGGVFYVEVKDGHINVEPYEYEDRNCSITMNADDFVRLLDGKLDPIPAFTFGKLKVDGDVGKALEFSKLLKQ